MEEILRLPQLIHRTGHSKSTIYALIARSEFPKPISISQRSVGWLASEVEAWIDERKQATRAARSSHAAS